MITINVVVQVFREFKGDTKVQEATWEKDVLIVLDLQVDEAMRSRGLAREVVNRVQKLRKKVTNQVKASLLIYQSGVDPADPVDVFFNATPESGALAVAMKAEIPYITSGSTPLAYILLKYAALGLSPLHVSRKPAHTVTIGTDTGAVC